MLSIDEFFNQTIKKLDLSYKEQKDNVKRVAELIGECILNDGVVQLFGLEHGKAFSMELYYRAGGLMPFHKFDLKDLLLRGIISKEEYESKDLYKHTEYLDKLYEIYNLYPNDMFIFISNYGNEPILVEACIKAKESGRKIVCVVNKKECDKAISIHPSNKKITDFADLVLDINGDKTMLDVDGVHKTGQDFTIISNVLAQMITAECYKFFKDRGLECPILLSANLKGADEHNRKLSNKYLGRWEN